MQVDYETSLIIDAIEKFGGEIRFVGGCVRDSILQHNTHDIDFATNLLPHQVIEALKFYNIKILPIGLKHGTIIAMINKRSFEITTLRYDTRCNGRYAKVEFTNHWQVDALRRDFTFNALYADKNYHIYDYFDGIKDLKEGRLNFIGNAEDRVKEDYLRILRVFRFHAKICVEELSDEILNVCKKYSCMIQSLSGERIRDEIFRLLECDNQISTLKSMQRSDVLQKIIPREVKCEILSSPLLSGADIIVKLALLLRTTKERLSLGEYISKFLRLSKRQKKKLMFLLSNNIGIGISKKEQKKYISSFGRELYCDLMRICGVEFGVNVDENISFAKIFDVPKFPLSGDDLIDIGFQSGKILGSNLELLRQRWEDSSYSLTREELLLYAKNLV
ncbi:MAG: CCA tRNA nucleotidyltransferase [Wolbachia endosymbiont of Meromenopon meropis]|nr:CCA tRNA nucleotidyltransferase [Wolbachia endosymbiont of Meromenopon meropis]